MVVKFEEFDDEFLRLSWEWINDKEIKYLINSPDITKKEQLTWFNNLKIRNDYYIRGVKVNDVRVGVVGIKNIIEHDQGEYFGYIGDKRYWRKGIGSIMIEESIKIATKKGLSCLYLKVIPDNYAAIGLYTKKGFVLNRTKSDSEELIYEYKILKS